MSSGRLLPVTSLLNCWTGQNGSAWPWMLQRLIHCTAGMLIVTRLFVIIIRCFLVQVQGLPTTHQRGIPFFCSKVVLLQRQCSIRIDLAAVLYVLRWTVQSASFTAVLFISQLTWSNTACMQTSHAQQLTSSVQQRQVTLSCRACYSCTTTTLQFCTGI